MSMGPYIKYVTLEGEKIVTGEGGQEHVTSRLYTFLSYIWNMKFKVMFNFLFYLIFLFRILLTSSSFSSPPFSLPLFFLIILRRKKLKNVRCKFRKKVIVKTMCWNDQVGTGRYETGTEKTRSGWVSCNMGERGDVSMSFPGLMLIQGRLEFLSRQRRANESVKTSRGETDWNENGWMEEWRNWLKGKYMYMDELNIREMDGWKDLGMDKREI